MAGSKNGHPVEVSNYKQHFAELNIQLFNFTIGCKFTDFHNCMNSNILSINRFELKVYKDVYCAWRYNFFPISDRVADLLI